MRKSFPAIVEDGRVRRGGMATSPGDPFGFFFIKRGPTQRLKVQVGDGHGWDHVSVSLGWKKPKSESPSWDMMCWVKNLFFGSEECVVQFHPRAADYVDDHPSCLHLWRCQDTDFPTPQPILVGPGRKQTEQRS